MKIWELATPGTLWDTPGLLRDSFTLHQRSTFVTFEAVAFQHNTNPESFYLE